MDTETVTVKNIITVNFIVIMGFNDNVSWLVLFTMQWIIEKVRSNTMN